MTHLLLNTAFRAASCADCMIQSAIIRLQSSCPHLSPPYNVAVKKLAIPDLVFQVGALCYTFQ